jgi:glutamyl-tRNA synthetase
MVNYLARLGWSHGDEELFTPAQFVSWFDLEHVSRSAAQFDPAKLAWLNQQHMKAASSERLAALAAPALRALGAEPDLGPALERVVTLLKDRATTVLHLAEAARFFYQQETPAPALVGEHLSEAARPALRTLKAKLAESPSWDRRAIAQAIEQALASSGLKMPQLAMPLRVLVAGRAQTPAIDAVLELLGRETVLARLAHYLDTD